VLRQTGPMAVSSANLHGRPPAATAGAAREQFGQAVDVYLEAGPLPGDQPSTVVTLVGTPRVLRPGAIPLRRLREVVPELRET
jgi:L-threonylcarbamoyladenylate synthase